MAFSLLAEAPSALPWLDIVHVLRNHGSAIEYFPIPGGGDAGRDAIGVSVPRVAATATGWRELEAGLLVLLDSFQMEVTDLYTGSKVTAATLDRVGRRLLGE